MRFTYTASLEDTQSEVLIISTQRNTKKYEIITANQNVALLVHDFVAEQAHDATNNQKLQGQTCYSITLNGVVKEQHDELAEKYRAIYLASNSEHSQFIVGDDIAVITVNPKRARVCDVNDRVTHFAKAESGKEWEEFPPKSWDASAECKTPRWWWDLLVRSLYLLCVRSRSAALMLVLGRGRRAELSRLEFYDACLCSMCDMCINVPRILQGALKWACA